MFFLLLKMCWLLNLTRDWHLVSVALHDLVDDCRCILLACPLQPNDALLLCCSLCCRGYQHFSTVTSTTAAPLSPTPVPSSPTRASAAAAQTSAAASAHAGGMPSPLGAHSAAPQLLATPEHPLLGARRNSLPPLRGVAGAPTSCSGGLQHSISTAAAALDRSGSFGMPSSPGSVRPASPLSPVAEAAAAGEGDKGLGGGSSSRGMDAVLLQAPSGFARLRSGSGVLGCGVAGGGAAVDAVAMQQLAAVRQAQASSYR